MSYSKKNLCEKKNRGVFLDRKEVQKKDLAERSFDLRTSGLWAQHASTAPLCFPDVMWQTFQYLTFV